MTPQGKILVRTLKVSGWPHATSREEVPMATLEAGTTQRNLFPGAWRTEGPDDRVTWHLPKNNTSSTSAPPIQQREKEKRTCETYLANPQTGMN